MRRNRSSQCFFGMILCAIVFATGPTMHAQTPVKPTPSPTPSSAPSLEREFFTNILRDQKAIWGVEGALKGITQRARPLDGVERSEFFDGGNSFPSGHSTGAWAVATVIANEYTHRRAVQVAAYATASAAGVARFTGQKHYLSDVLAGSALGYGIGKYVYNTNHQESFVATGDTGPVSTSWWPAISPQLDRHAHAYGVGLTWSFKLSEL